jgi:hypothetical protein
MIRMYDANDLGRRAIIRAWRRTVRHGRSSILHDTANLGNHTMLLNTTSLHPPCEPWRVWKFLIQAIGGWQRGLLLPTCHAVPPYDNLTESRFSGMLVLRLALSISEC